ncbi:NAD(P)H-dependent glycerol-3-phosphate dehydrogenase [Marinobacterium sedimentorum]|uniref:NAD(P)H-dependent glycerol-3-phosphate dehydrogenase n=1 Tax=Marinobacterium sedimentorum TaxID=2927804 RepID=UPI0020C6CAEB|nr:NAD(P)H-dependent glycerol-3-phosphate dehydrogenase [Marinobacterium sedimentorum]MCP8689265.1 NAD(P)H-dependent glycerol-3-phosphate dehydrogenase [Marinobacterium sedimentorum]
MKGAMRVTVLGGGSFGTVLANIMAEKGIQVRLWMRDAQQVENVRKRRENSKYLPGYPLAATLEAHTSLADALSGAELVFVAIPSGGFRAVVHEARAYMTPGQMVVSTTKGIEAGTFSLMSEILADELPDARIGVLSGPNLAKEVAARQLTATVIASESEALRERVQSTLHTAYFRVYASTDMYGVELGGALKNIYAIAAGMSNALGMGENTRSMLMTRSLAEMSRFAVSMGANPLTFLGLAGVGDLIVTCMSPLSRNYRVGFALGEGKTLEQAVTALGEVAEGVNTLHRVKEKADQLGIYMPLVDGLYEVVFNHAPAAAVAKMLMLNEQSSDVEFVLPRS